MPDSTRRGAVVMPMGKDLPRFWRRLLVTASLATGPSWGLTRAITAASSSSGTRATTWTTSARHLLDARYAVARAHYAIALDSKSFDQYVGEYRSSLAFGLTVTREGKHFFVQGTGQKKSELFAGSDSVF
jgi:hypothetical protein